MQVTFKPRFRADFNNNQFRRKEQVIELVIFLFLIVPSMAFSFFIGGNDSGPGFFFTAVANILRDLALMGLVLFFLWRNGEPVTTIGWNLRKAGTETALALGLFVPFLVLVALIQNLLRMAGFTVVERPPPQLTMTGGNELLLALLLLTVVAVVEETIFRGYLIARLGSLTRSTAAAILLSALIFSLGHGYEGSAGVVTVGIVGMIFGAIYIWRKSIVAPVVMHFLFNFVGLILLR